MLERQTEVMPEKKTDHGSPSVSAIFVIGDDSTQLDLLERKLSEYSFRVSVFHDPLRLIEELETKRPTSIFVDLEMRSMDGTEMITMARQRGYEGHVVLATLSKDSDLIVSAIQAGADDVLSKPVRDFELELIVEKIRLRSSQNKSLVTALKMILQPIEQGVILTDENLNLVFANKRACEILAADAVEEVGGIIKNGCPERIFEQSEQRRVATTFLEINRSSQDKQNLVGLEVYYLDSLLPSPCYLLLMRDFTQWRKLDELRSKFATYLSHRMRTPLTVMRNALKILTEENEVLDHGEKEKLLDIGSRNIEKLISSLDEVQKIFMIESEEMNVCRTLLKVKSELKPVLCDLERDGRINGFKLKMPDLTIITGRGRLKDFVTTVVSAFEKWLQEAPFIECISSIREDFRNLGGVDRRLKISLRPRPGLRVRECGMSLKDFLSYHEAHLGLVLTRLATALDGEIEIHERNAISLLLPLDPPLDHEKDLVHPLHMMLERADLSGGEFHLANLRMVGVMDGSVRFTKILEECLCALVSQDGLVSRGEEPISYSIFFVNKSADDVVDVMKCIHERFKKSCRERGEEIYPSIRWEIRYSRTQCSAEQPVENCLVEELV